MHRDEGEQESRSSLSPTAEVEAALLRELVDSIKGVLFEFDAETRYVNMWTAQRDLLAMPWEQVQGRTIEEVLGPEVGGPYAAIIRRVLATGARETIEYPMQVPQGLRWFAAEARPTPPIPGRPPTVTFLTRDITEKKLAEEALRDSKERYRLLFDLSPLPTWLLDEKSYRFLEVNEAACRQYGYSREDQSHLFGDRSRTGLCIENPVATESEPSTALTVQTDTTLRQRQRQCASHSPVPHPPDRSATLQPTMS